ncbi:MAG TPA: hypothetical protein VF913_12125 [Xanthobacteraceae bacterium]
MLLIGFPLLIIPLAIYNMIVFLTPGVAWSEKVATVRLPSQTEWPITFGDGVIAIALFLLFVEGLKASRAAGKPMVDHLLSMLVFLGALAEFLLVKEAATSTFAVITAICLVDLAEGLAISGRAARHRRTIERLEAQAPDPGTTA